MEELRMGDWIISLQDNRQYIILSKIGEEFIISDLLNPQYKVEQKSLVVGDYKILKRTMEWDI